MYTGARKHRHASSQSTGYCKLSFRAKSHSSDLEVKLKGVEVKKWERRNKIRLRTQILDLR